MVKKYTSRPRATFEDGLRALGYFAIASWAALFFIFPPVSYVNSIDFWIRFGWLFFCFAGAVTAFIGAARRIDLKLEFPGIATMWIGPLFYTLAQVYYLFYPSPTDTPNSRIALVVYAVLPILFSSPRFYALLKETRRQRVINSVPKKVK